MKRSLIELKSERRKEKEEERSYQPYGAALELMKDKQREVLMAGPAGTGKSRACLEKLNLVAMQVPIRGAIVRKVRKTLAQSALVTWEEKVLPKPLPCRFWTEDQEYRYGSGAIVAVCGLDDPEKVKSTEFDLIYVQEATELEQLDWELLVSRLRNGVLSYQQLIADCNPADPYHWLKQRCDRGECVLLDTRHEDNPVLFDHGRAEWTQFGRTYLETLDTLTGYTYQRLRLGQWVAAEGMYFTEWNPAVHVVDEDVELKAEWPRWVSVDYGFAAPFCALWFCRDPESRVIYCYRERYGAGLRDEEQAELIREASEGERIVLRVLDPSMFNARTEAQRPSIAQVYAGVLGEVVAGQNNRRTGWAVVRRALAVGDEGPRLRVVRGRCPNLERTLPAMVMDRLDPEDVADKVKGQKTEDHAVDALRYGLCVEAQPERPREPLQLQFG